jgi:exodeoxyribonuclease-3
LKLATWNVNGIRARQGELLSWLETERPDVVCLQEIKAAPDQLTFELAAMESYWSVWHGQKGYSGVGILVGRHLAEAAPLVVHPPFDFEARIATVDVTTGWGVVTIASVYVPNGGKDYPAKLEFLDALDVFAADAARAGRAMVICGDLNVARTDRDIHPKERKPNQIGARAEERERLERILAHDLTDVGRALDPDNDALFTWWAPWRNLKQRNIGWRIDYVIASTALAALAVSCTVQREVGTSDHGPVVATFSDGVSRAPGPSL